jgi:micrococcal nuclease
MLKVIPPIAAQILALLLLPALALAWPGKVISIQDADTITVLTEERQQMRIRLYGIDAPEGGQAYGNKATQFVKGLLADRPVVEIDVKDIDRYGRTVAVVILPDGTNLNEEIVGAGYAWVFTRYCKEMPMCVSWGLLQHEAMEARRGLWTDKEPVPPWEWRRR